jgi:outer membrane protein OmpA-like peptidoglycan-associated protein
MKVRRGLTLAVVTAVAGSPAAAQGGAGIELGVYGAWFVPDGDVAATSGVGGGARATVPFTRRFALDVDLGWHAAGAGDVTAIVPAAAVVFGAPSGASGPFIGGGFARPSVSVGGAGRVADGAVVALAGYRRFLARRVALRLDARALIVPASDLPGIDRAVHGILSLGVALFPTRAPDPDQDGDGVPDTRDRCFGTPAGSVVDVRGCPRDSDGDGVVNGADACPHTPAGTITTADGCPLDEDGDQVYDGMDQCPGTPTGAPVDLRGCPADSDGDGVVDGPDQCPQTPAGVVVDPAGGPRDGDGDGVPDGVDRCPGTPPGVAVESDGCAPVRRAVDTLFTEARRSFELRGVYFETGKARLLPQSTAVLDEVAAALLANPQWRVEVAGYTDSTGSGAVNRRLSLARADAVRAYLVRAGVPPSRLVARGYGPSHPVAPNATAAGRARNRRVELRQLE